MPPRLSLHDVEDAHAFVGAIVGRTALGSRDEYEDLRAYVLAELWRLSTRYDGSGGSRFSAWARSILGRRVVDWRRGRYGRTRWQFADRTYEYERPTLVPYDDRDGADRLDLGGAERALDGNPAAGGQSALRGIFAARDRQAARDLDLLGREPY